MKVISRIAEQEVVLLESVSRRSTFYVLVTNGARLQVGFMVLVLSMKEVEYDHGVKVLW